MTASKTVIVLGGGVGGVAAARVLRKRLAPRHRVVLVDREREHVFAPSLLWLMVGLRDAERIKRPLERLRSHGIDVRTGEIGSIDLARRAVVVASHELVGDYMIVALGAQLVPERVPGLLEAGYNFYSLSGALSLRDAIRAFRSGRIVVLTAAPAYKCPAAPYEAALLLEAFCRRQGIREKTSIDIFAAEPAPMGVAGQHVSQAVRDLLEQKRIGYHPEHQIAKVSRKDHRIFFTNGASTDFDLLAFVPPHQAPKVVRDAFQLGDGEWVSVDRQTLATRFENVFAIGDVVAIPLTLGKPLPKAGVFANGEAEVVAANIASAINGVDSRRKFDGHGSCFIEAGDGKAGFGGGDFFAEPRPAITLRPPSRRSHLGKVLFEKFWLWRQF